MVAYAFVPSASLFPYCLHYWPSVHRLQLLQKRRRTGWFAAVRAEVVSRIAFRSTTRVRYLKSARNEKKMIKKNTKAKTGLIVLMKIATIAAIPADVVRA